MLVARGWGEGKWEVMVKGHSFGYIRWLSPGGLLSSVTPIANNTSPDTYSCAKRVDLICAHNSNKQRGQEETFGGFWCRRVMVSHVYTHLQNKVVC